MTDAISEGYALSKFLSRKQEKFCVSCGWAFNSWGMRRDRCLLCDPIPPKLAKVYREQIDTDDAMVRL